MEVYILDGLFRRDTVVDRFESCIWTERYSSAGDFQLVTHSTRQNKAMFQKGLKLAMNRSRRVMMIENVDDKDDAEGRSLLTISGRSLEAMLAKRSTVSERLVSDIGPSPEFYEITGTPAHVARVLFQRICLLSPVAGDNLPFVTNFTDSLYPPNTIPEPIDNITVAVAPAQLYDALKELVDAYGLGFRLYRGPDNQRLYFNVYSGNDRTSTQNTLPAVILSPDLENLTNTSDFSSIEQEANVVYVIGKDRNEIVYAVGSGSATSGYDRKVITVEARDIAGTDAAALSKLRQKGREALAKNRAIQALDGELSQNSRYIYDADYSLGDLIEIRNDDGATSRMRITEQIFVDDEQGERTYPTISTDAYIVPGSWASLEDSLVWDTAVGTWADQPA